MTVQEAIDWLENLEGMIEDNHNNDYDTAFKIAKECMEKQIPKKPTETHEIKDGTFYRIDFMCPSCNTSVVCQPYKPNYCKHCGQKLDWEEGGTSD